jgi:hypothetical protein
MEIERNRRWEVVAQQEVELAAALDPYRGGWPLERCDLRRRPSRVEGDGICRGAQVDGLAPLGGCNAR